MAGAFMLVDVVFIACSMAAGNHHSRGILGKLLLGTYLLKGSFRALSIGRALTWLALVLSLPVGYFSAPLGIGLAAESIGILLLLASKVRTWRVIVGTVLALAVLGVSALGTLYEVTGFNPVAKVMMAGQGEPLPADRTVHGKAVAYSYQLPEGEGWALLKAEEGNQLNPEMEGWAINAERGLYLAVVAETDVAPEVTAADLGSAVKESMADTQWLDDKPLGDGLVLHSKEKFEDIYLQRLVLVKVKDGKAVQVHAWGDSETFPKNEAMLRGILETVKL